MGLSGESTGMGMNEKGTVDRLGIGETDGGTLEGPTITASRVGSIGLNTDNFRLYDEVGNSYFHNVGDTRTFDMNQNDPNGVLQSSPLSFTKGGLTREEVYTGFGQWKPTSEFGYLERQKLASSFIIGGAATNSAIKGATGLLSRLGSNYVNLASVSRTRHIIAGDATGGGHAWFGSPKSFMNGLTGKKSMFPITWSNSKIMNGVSEVVTSNPWVQQTGRAGAMFTRSGRPVRFVTEGFYKGTKIRVISTRNEIITAFPIK